MNKIIQTLRIVCAASWLGVLTIAIFKPMLDYRLPLILASAILVITYIVEFIAGGELHDRQIKESDTE